jgi:heptosyltransferase-1
LRRLYPHAKIDWVVEQSCAELVQAHPDLSLVIPAPIKEWRKRIWSIQAWYEIKQWISSLRQVSYDLIFDLQGNVKSGLITKFAKGKRKIGFGFKTLSEWPNVLATTECYNPPPGMNIREDYLFLVQKALNIDFFSSSKIQLKTEGIELRISTEQEKQLQVLLQLPCLKHSLKVMICPGSFWPNKQLSLVTLSHFLNYLSQNYDASFVLIWGTNQEKELVKQLASPFPTRSVVIDRLSLPTLQALMSKMDLVVSVDSLALHLAGTTQTPTYSIFGSSLAKKYQPLGLIHESFQGACPYGKKFEKRCSILRTCSTGSCIKDLTFKELTYHFSNWWEKIQLCKKLTLK